MISHATADDTATEHAETVKPACAQQAATPVCLPTLSEADRFPGGSETAGPGDADISAWQAGSRQETQTTGYGSTGREP